MNQVPDPRAVAAYAAGAAPLLGLTIDPAWRAGVIEQLHVILRAAAIVGEFPLADDVEPATVFRP